MGRSLARVNVIQLLVFLTAVAALVPRHGAVGMAASVCVIYLIALPPTLGMLVARLRVLRPAPSRHAPVRRVA
jgi:hypothetical protein